MKTFLRKVRKRIRILSRHIAHAGAQNKRKENKNKKSDQNNEEGEFDLHHLHLRKEKTHYARQE